MLYASGSQVRGAQATPTPTSALPGGATDAFTPILVRALGATTAPVFGDDGRYHLMYDLWLTNAKAAPATIERIEVVDRDNPDGVVAAIEGESLIRVMTELNLQPVSDATLPLGSSKLLFVNITFDRFADIPGAVAHRVVGAGAANPAATEPTALDSITTPIPLHGFRPPVLAAPLRGAGWVAANGPGLPLGAHRSAVQAVNGSLFNAQRFAIDWMHLNEAGLLVDGDQEDLTNWAGYGQPVHAVADGRVIATLDNLPDQVPGQLPDPASITLATVDGNHVVLDIGGLWVFYAHLAPGSVRVEPGDRVQVGDQLGALGNTGNTSAPHLHLHVMDGPSVLGSNSVPYVFDAFSLTGALDPVAFGDGLDLGQVWNTAGQPMEPGAYQLRLPQNLHIVEWTTPA